METLYTLSLTLEEVRAIKRVASHLAYGRDTKKSYVHIQVHNIDEFERIVQKLFDSVAQTVIK